MSSRSLLHNTIRITSALALLAAVIASPIRPAKPCFGSSPDCLRRNFGLPGSHTTHTTVKLTNAPSVVKAVRSQSEQKRNGPSGLARYPFGGLIASPPHTLSHTEPAILGLPLGPHPLRC